MKKIITYILDKILDNLLGQVSFIFLINIIVSIIITPTKNLFPVLLTIVRNPYWLSSLFIILALLVTRHTYIKSIDRLQLPVEHVIFGDPTIGTIKKNYVKYEFIFPITQNPTYRGSWIINAIDVEPIRCPDCRQDLIQKRSIITGRYTHYCPYGHNKFSNKLSNNTMEQRELTYLKRNFNILDTEEQNKFIEKHHLTME